MPAVASRRRLSKRTVRGRARRQVKSWRGKGDDPTARRPLFTRRRVVVGKRFGGTNLSSQEREDICQILRTHDLDYTQRSSTGWNMGHYDRDNIFIRPIWPCSVESYTPEQKQLWLDIVFRGGPCGNQRLIFGHSVEDITTEPENGHDYPTSQPLKSDLNPILSKDNTHLYVLFILVRQKHFFSEYEQFITTLLQSVTHPKVILHGFRLRKIQRTSSKETYYESLGSMGDEIKYMGSSSLSSGTGDTVESAQKREGMYDKPQAS